MKPSFRSFHGPSDWGWVQSHQRLRQVEDTSGVIAVDDETERTVAGVLMDHWTHNSVHVHIIVEDTEVLHHGFIEEVADYVFNHCGKQVMIGVVPGNNARVRKFAEQVGFVEIACVSDAFDDEVDMVFLSLTAEQCRYYSPPPEVVAA